MNYDLRIAFMIGSLSLLFLIVLLAYRVAKLEELVSSL